MFKQSTGSSFKEYLNMVRVEESKRLLANTDYTIVDIAIAALSIGFITFFCSLAGTWLGKKFGSLLGRFAEIFGGCILVGIGLKIFIEHMF